MIRVGAVAVVAAVASCAALRVDNDRKKIAVPGGKPTPVCVGIGNDLLDIGFIHDAVRRATIGTAVPPNGKYAVR